MIMFYRGKNMYRYQRLRDLREDNDLVQKEIAAVLNTSQKQYSRWETGAREIPAHHLLTLANFYKTSIDYLMGITNTKEPYKKK